MTRPALLSLLLLTACGPKPTATAPVGNDGEPARTAGHPAPTPCPADVTELARSAWGLGAGSVNATCVALWTGEPLWYLDGWFEPEPNDDYMVGTYSAIVTPAGAVKWKLGDDALSYAAMERYAVGDHQAADLDGDGDDELLYVTSYSHGGNEEQHLVGLAIGADGAPIPGEAEPISLSYDNSAAMEDPGEVRTCEATFALIDGPDRARLVEVTRAGSHCEPPGRTVYRWNGKAFEVER